MSWDAEFGRDYEVPGILTFLAKKKVLEDLSWHNDAAPSFGTYDHKQEMIVRLWVDHPFLSEREVGGQRFAVVRDKDHENKYLFETNELEEALEALFAQLAILHTGVEETGVFGWRPGVEKKLTGSPWDSPKDYLDELKKKYFAKTRA